MTDIPKNVELPPLLKAFAEVIGFEAVVKLVHSEGGAFLHIARRPRPTSRLARAIGIEPATKLGEAFGPWWGYIPMGKTAVAHTAPVAEIRRRLAAGESLSSIARATGFCVKTVRNIRDGRTRRRMTVQEWLNQEDTDPTRES